MTDFCKKWLEVVHQKNSLLCVGIDPAEQGQRADNTIPAGTTKLEYSLRLIEQVAPYASAIKPNRNYFKDFSRSEMQQFNRRVHELNMLSIDDSKLADIGDTNDAGFFHASQEGFDLVTYAPFPGNIKGAVTGARAHHVGLITLVLMSNPEYKVIKEAHIAGKKGFEYFAAEVAVHGGDGVVIGAPSPSNHITESEVRRVREIIGDRLVLVPGLGAQGGEVSSILSSFGDYSIVNVGRAIMYAADPAAAAQHYRDLLNGFRK
jgi:orotidine-5'-phosphate decarboxylase